MTRLKKYGFLVSFLFPILVVIGVYAGGLWTFTAFVVGYILIPILDGIIGTDPENISKEDYPKMSKDRFFDFVVYAYVYWQYALLIWGCYVMAFYALSTLELVGFLLSTMVVTSCGINVGHELGHKKSPVARFHAQAILMTVFYMHFYIEHNRGHHVKVATPEDSATARKGQTYYAFWVQSVLGGYWNAWKLEFKRLQKRNLPKYSPQNQMIFFSIAPVLWYGALILGFGTWAGGHYQAIALYLVVQAFLAVSSLEAVNYIEHYGMERQQLPDGKYERVNPLHSWNSNHWISNLFLFQLQRHSDHHAFAIRPYQILRHFDQSPQLPTGYPLMIMTALIPPLWFGMMNKRLEDWKAKSYDQEHIKKAIQETI